jgi:DNA-binding CsgD family transcriptional regulator
MRYFDFTLTTEDGTLHPVERAISETRSIRRDSVLHFDTLGDETSVLLYRLEGDPEVLVPEVGDHPDVISHDLLEADDEVFHLYLHLEPGDPATLLMDLTETYTLMIDTPIEFSNRGSIRMTIIGAHDMVRQAMEELPEEIGVSVDEVGNYSPDRRDMLSALTDRQLEVFRTAVELGYYEIPRRATHEEIADRLECAPSTVDEHLRKAESQVLRGLVG